MSVQAPSGVAPLPPQNLDAEQAVLGSMLIERPAVEKAAEILKADVIFRAVVCPRGRHEIRFTFHPFAGALAEVVGKMTHNARP